MKFQGHLLQEMRAKLGMIRNCTRDDDLDEALTSLLTEEGSVLVFEQRIDELSEAITLASKNSFPMHKTNNKSTAHK
jgi:hypothetical protein